jgi:hypothetical protein
MTSVPMFSQAETPKCLVEAKYLCPPNGHSPGVAWSQLASPTHFDLSLNLVRTTSIYNRLAPVVNMLSYGGLGLGQTYAGPIVTHDGIYRRK